MTEWKTVEKALNHLTSELLRLQQQEMPWLMTPVEEGDLLHTIEQAQEALSKDMEPEPCQDCPPELPEGVKYWMRTEIKPWDYTCESCGSHWDKYTCGAAL